MKTTENTSRNIPDTILRIALAVILPAFSVVAISLVASAAVTPAKYFWPVAIVWLLLSLAIGYGIFRASKKRLVRTIVSIFSALVFVAANIVAVSLAAKINTFFADIQEAQKHTENYNLIVMKDNAGVYADINNPSIDYLITDPYAADVAQFIDTNLSANATEASGPMPLTIALTTQAVHAALVNDAYLSLFETDHEDFYNSVTIIATYDIPVSTQAIVTAKAPVTEPFVLYISGIDVRTHDLPFSARSDVNMLIVVNPKTHKILTVNTPRDVFVDLASFGKKDKLTHAGLYGVNESIRTLEKFYGMSIDYYARVNFDALTGVVDAVGGVDVYSEYAFTTIHGGYHYRKGWNHLTGKTALSFSRERINIAWAGGDRARGKNQQLVIEAIFKKLTQPSNLTNADVILAAITDSLQTNLSANSIKTLIRTQLDTMAAWQFENISVDGIADLKASTYTYPELDLFVWWPLEDTVNDARAKIAQYLQP